MNSRPAARRLAACACVLLSTAAQTPAEVGPLDRTLAVARPAVVRVVAGVQAKVRWRGREYDVASGHAGTGFFVDPRGYVLTSAHLVQSVGDASAQKRAILDGLVAPVADDLGLPNNKATTAQLMAAFKEDPPEEVKPPRPAAWVIVAGGERLPFKVVVSGQPGDLAVLHVGISNVPVLMLGDSDATKVGERVFLVGFPQSVDFEAAVEGASPARPGASIGSVASRKLLPEGVSLIETDIAAAADSPGSPLLDVSGRVIGVAMSAGPAGPGFAIPAKAARAGLQQAGAENKLGPADVKYAEGLEHFWHGRYSLAKDRFAEVMALFPQHVEARGLLAESIDKISSGQEVAGAGGGWGRWLVGLGIGGALLAAAGFGVMKARAARPAAAVAAPPAAPPAVPPSPSRSAAADATMVAGGRSLPRREVVTRPSDADGATVVFSGSVTASLVGVAGPTRGSFLIGSGLTIGRKAEKCQLVVPDVQVSTQHAWVGLDGGRILVRDLGSTNGTFLNDALDRPIQEAELRDGDEITLGRAGSVKFKFQH